MILGPIAKTDIPLLTTPTGNTERVCSFKLLGVLIESSLCWSTQSICIVNKVTRRLYFLKQPNRAVLSSNQLLQYYVIWVVLKYCDPAWHYALTREQTQQLEAMQKRAIHVIFNFTRCMPYSSMLYMLQIPVHWSVGAVTSPKNVPWSYLPLLLPLSPFPPPRKQYLTTRRRSYEEFPNAYTPTRRYCSFWGTLGINGLTSAKMGHLLWR